MDLPALLISDLHLTANPRDNYRWNLFPWLAKECEYEGVKSLAILGDLTDAKDYHPSELIIRICKELSQLLGTCSTLENIYILMGNHDYLREGSPTFSILQHIPGIRFISKIEESFGDMSCLWLPHTKTPNKDWVDLDASYYNFVFMHQTVSGSRSSNGQKMEGELLPSFKSWGKIYSGDIHVPQVIGDVEYVGSPYHVHFGDKFKPRAVLLTKKEAVDLHMGGVQRFVIDCTGTTDLKRQLKDTQAGDQVSVRVHLEPSERSGWENIRRDVVAHCNLAEIQLCGVSMVCGRSATRVRLNGVHRATLSPSEALLQFVEREGWGPDAFDVGMELL